MVISAAADRKLKDAQVRATINQKLIETGEKERFGMQKAPISQCKVKGAVETETCRMWLERRNEANL